MIRVLIVDDSEAVRESLREALADEGFVADAVGGGAEAVAAARAAPPDVVLLDLVLPGSDGLRVAADLARGGCRAPVVVLSGDRAGGRAALAAGAAAFLPKPFDLSELLAAIGRVAPPKARDSR